MTSRNAEKIRKSRRINIVLLIFEAAIFTLEYTLTGSIYNAMTPGIIALLLVVLIGYQTGQIKAATPPRVTAPPAPRVDYNHIADLERGIYGETFTHEHPDTP